MLQGDYAEILLKARQQRTILIDFKPLLADRHSQEIREWVIRAFILGASKI
jgi:hypothetical protein